MNQIIFNLEVLNNIKNIRMLNFYIMKKYMFVSLSFLALYPDLSTSESFEMVFQSSGHWSKDEWSKFEGKISPLNELTSCHWDKFSFQSIKTNTIWSYCYIETKDESELKCIQLYSMSDLVSYGRNIVYALWIPGIGNQTFDIQFEAKSFQHRSWNHVCLVYSSIRNKVSIYYNGKLWDTVSYESLPEIPGIGIGMVMAMVMALEWPESHLGKIFLT